MIKGLIGKKKVYSAVKNQKSQVTMIKIDVEGHEIPVLIGGIETIKKNKPIIFIENLSHGYPHLFKENQFDEFFEKGVASKK